MDPVNIEINNKIGLVKLGLKVLGGFGTSKIVGGIVENNVVTTSGFQKASVWVAKFGIVNILANQVEAHTDKFVDDAVDAYHKVRKAIQEQDTKQDTPETKGP